MTKDNNSTSVIKKAITQYHKQFGNYAPVPDAEAKLGKQFIQLLRNGKKLCRLNIASGEFDQLSKAVKQQVKIIEETIELQKKYAPVPFPFKKELGEEFNYYKIDYNRWLKCDPSGKQPLSCVTIELK